MFVFLLYFCFVFYLFIGRSVVGLLSIPDLFFYLWWWEKGFLDGQFLQLQQLQDENNPDFVVEVVSLFFEDSERLLKDLTFALSVLLLSYHSRFPSFHSSCIHYSMVVIKVLNIHRLHCDFVAFVDITPHRRQMQPMRSLLWSRTIKKCWC